MINNGMIITTLSPFDSRMLLVLKSGKIKDTSSWIVATLCCFSIDQGPHTKYPILLQSLIIFNQNK